MKNYSATISAAAVVLAAVASRPFLHPVSATAAGTRLQETAFALPIDKNRIVDLAQRMIRINSEYEKDVVHNHKPIVDLIAREIRAIGYETEVITQNPDFPIVVARLRGTVGKPVLGITEMYNTVYIGDRARWTVDPLGGVIKDGKLYGRGAENSKGSLAATLETARAVKAAASAHPLKGDLVFLYTPGEGGEAFCLPWVVEHRRELIKADWYLAGGGGGTLTRMAGGHIWARLVVQGTVAHPGMTVGGRAPVNAIHKLAKLIPAVMNVDDWMTWEPHPLFANYVSTSGVGKPFVEVGKIAGGYEVNMVPDRAVADIDIRVLPKQTAEKVLSELDALFAKMAKADPDLHVEVQRIGSQIVPYHYWDQLSEEDPLIKTIFQVAPTYTGKKPEWRMSAGGGRPDLWASGAKWISFGITKGDGAHSADEWVDVDSLVKQAQLYAELALRMLK
jgi:succinyl-diaminopimelate desuccinylase